MPVATEPEKTDRRTPILWAAAAVAAVIFGGAAFYAYRLGAPGTQWSSFDPFGTNTPSTYSAATIVPGPAVEKVHVFTLPEEPLGIRVLPLTPKDTVLLTVDLGRPAPVEAVRETTAVVVPKAETVTKALDLRFHVIGGCFAQPENAEKKLAELLAKGYPAVRLKQRGQLTPVAYGSYATRKEALEAMAAVRKESGAAAWLLVR